MSIYPVPLQKWFPNPNKYIGKGWEEYINALIDYSTLRMIIKYERCKKCNKNLKYNRVWGHHSLPRGYGDMWCSKECLFNKRGK